MRRDGAAMLERAGVPSPQHDSRALQRHAEQSGVDVGPLLAARARRVPLQHIVGTAGFRYLDLLVGPGVFVPRPETEPLVDATLLAIRDLPAPVVVDLCAGSGAIGLSIAHEHPGAVVHVVEVDPDAVTWLRRNLDARPPEESRRVALHHADLDAAPTGLDGRVDLVAGNPPYLPLRHAGDIEPEVEHDPAFALWGGTDGLDVIRRLVPRAAVLLRPGGTLVVEHSEDHEAAVPDLVRANGFTEVVCHPDLTGRPRYTTARRTGPAHA